MPLLQSKLLQAPLRIATSPPPLPFLVKLASDATLSADKTIAANKNVMMVGPIEIDDGVTITIPSTSRLVILG